MITESLDSAVVPRDPVETVAAHLRTWETPHVDLAIFGSADPELIVATVDRFCRAHLGRGIEAYLFFVSSQGSTHGVQLQGGERVVVKIHQPPGLGPERTSDIEKLRMVQRALEHLAERGFPCPRPLLGPTPLARGTAVAETFLSGARGDGLSPDQRRAIAWSSTSAFSRRSPIPCPASTRSSARGGPALFASAQQALRLRLRSDRERGRVDRRPRLPGEASDLW